MSTHEGPDGPAHDALGRARSAERAVADAKRRTAYEEARIALAPELGMQAELERRLQRAEESCATAMQRRALAQQIHDRQLRRGPSAALDAAAAELEKSSQSLERRQRERDDVAQELSRVRTDVAARDAALRQRYGLGA